MLAALALAVLSVSAPARWATDDTGTVPAAVVQQLDGRLEAFEKSTGHQVVLYVGRTTGQEPIEDWAVRTFKEWKVGRKGLDDGAALFVFLDDRAARIEVGYGLEPTLTDAQASRILRERLIPRMARGDVAGGLHQAVDGILSTIAGQTGPPPGGEAPGGVAVSPGQRTVMIIGIVLLVALFIFNPRLGMMVLMMILHRGRGGGPGGGGGWRGGGGRSGGGGATGRW